MAAAPSTTPALEPPRTARDIRKLAAAANKCERAVISVYAGMDSDETRAAVAAIAPANGFAPPPERR